MSERSRVQITRGVDGVDLAAAITGWKRTLNGYAVDTEALEILLLQKINLLMVASCWSVLTSSGYQGRDWDI
jgi:hypothetical protein